MNIRKITHRHLHVRQILALSLYYSSLVTHVTEHVTCGHMCVVICVTVTCGRTCDSILSSNLPMQNLANQFDTVCQKHYQCFVRSAMS